jgi:CheY-like chemotaxis protein
MARDCVLVVDDDKEIREGLVELLEESGCVAVGAENGLKAMEVLKSRQDTCLIFLDLSMPVMDGNAFREEQVKYEALRDIPVVLISAFSELRRESKALHVDGYMQKPLDAGRVINTARRYCACSEAPA